MIFNRSDALTVANTISGSGSLTQMGAGTLTLTSTNTYTGDTTISAGTLTIGGSGTLGAGLYAGAVTISSGAAMDYASSSDQDLSGVVSGTDLIRVTGTGVLTLSGSNNTRSTTESSNAGGTGTDTTSTAATSTDATTTVTSNPDELNNITAVINNQDTTIYFYTDSANIPTWTPITTYAAQFSTLPSFSIETTYSSSDAVTTTDTTYSSDGISITTDTTDSSKGQDTKTCFSKVLCLMTKKANTI